MSLLIVQGKEKIDNFVMIPLTESQLCIVGFMKLKI